MLFTISQFYYYTVPPFLSVLATLEPELEERKTKGKQEIYI